MCMADPGEMDEGTDRRHLKKTECAAANYKKRKNSRRALSIYPFGKVITVFQCRCHLSRIHGNILGEVLGVLPLEEFLAILRIWLAPEVAIGSSLLVFWLT